MTNPESIRSPASRAKYIIVVAGAALVLYLASPYYSVWRFGETLRAHDMTALAARVDFDAVRASRKQQIRDHFMGVLTRKKKDRLAQFLSAEGNDPLGQIIDAYVTPEGLAALISDPAPIKNATSISSLPNLESAPRQIDWSKARHAFFTGPRDFAAEHEGIKLRFRFNGLGWRLRALDLQLEEKTETLKN